MSPEGRVVLDYLQDILDAAEDAAEFVAQGSASRSSRKTRSRRTQSFGRWRSSARRRRRFLIRFERGIPKFPGERWLACATS